MSNFSCKMLDYVNPNDVGGGRESTECVFVAGTRDQLQSRSRYVQQGWAATWILSAQHCVQRRWCRAVRETQNQTKKHIQAGQTKSLPPCVSLLKKVALTACAGAWWVWACLLLWQGAQGPGKPAQREHPLWGGVPVQEKVEAQEGWVDLCHHTQGASVQGGKRLNSCACKAQ